MIMTEDKPHMMTTFPPSLFKLANNTNKNYLKIKTIKSTWQDIY
jgi:hypothetical protein